MPSAPLELRLTRCVTPVSRSRTKTSAQAFVSPATRAEELEENATKRPSGVITDGEVALAPTGVPAGSTLMHSTLPVQRSRTKTSAVP